MQQTACIYMIVFLLCSPNSINCLGTKHDATILANALNFTGVLLHEALQLLSRANTVVHPGPIDCTDVQKAGNIKSGIYRIWPLNWETYGSFQVYCDMETDGGAWAVIQRRGDFEQPQNYFHKTWGEYQMGFGELDKYYWLGNDKIFALTNQGNYSLRIDMKDRDEKKSSAIYQEFWIENEKQMYTLHVSSYTGDEGDSFVRANGKKFTTADKYDGLWYKKCAEFHRGGWWYDQCQSPHLNTNLNSLYMGSSRSFRDEMRPRYRGRHFSLLQVEMMIRRV